VTAFWSGPGAHLVPFSHAATLSTLQGEIAYLRMNNEVYRTHLRTYREALLRNVDEWARAEQSPPGMEHQTPLP
jgi:hypothetical protein